MKFTTEMIYVTVFYWKSLHYTRYNLQYILAVTKGKTINKILFSLGALFNTI